MLRSFKLATSKEDASKGNIIAGISFLVVGYFLYVFSYADSDIITSAVELVLFLSGIGSLIWGLYNKFV